jgi:hypothetical protein
LQISERGTSPSAEDRSSENPFAALNGYDVQHVVAHLICAGRDRDVHRLLRLEIGEQRRNGWFAERERRGDVDGYLHGLHALEISPNLYLNDMVAIAAKLPRERLLQLIRRHTRICHRVGYVRGGPCAYPRPEDRPPPASHLGQLPIQLSLRPGRE